MSYLYCQNTNCGEYLSCSGGDTCPICGWSAGRNMKERVDADMTSQELADKYAGEDGSWGEHPEHTREEWRDEVANDDTLQGYWDWVASQIEEASHDPLL